MLVAGSEIELLLAAKICLTRAVWFLGRTAARGRKCVRSTRGQWLPLRRWQSTFERALLTALVWPNYRSYTGNSLRFNNKRVHILSRAVYQIYWSLAILDEGSYTWLFSVCVCVCVCMCETYLHKCVRAIMRVRVPVGVCFWLFPWLVYFANEANQFQLHVEHVCQSGDLYSAWLQSKYM